MLQLTYGVMTAGILMNFTRTALYGIASALAFALFWYAIKGQLKNLAARILAIGGSALLGASIMVSSAAPMSDYARYKLDNIFNRKEIVEGESSTYRLAAMEAVIDNTLGSDKRMLIGNGWGQTYYEVFGLEVQAGGGDCVNLLGFSGFIGVAAYLLYSFFAFTAAARLARRRDRSQQTLLAEGVLFSLVGMFVTGQISGYLIAPEYYLLLGICVYLSLLKEPRRPNLVRHV